MFSSPTSFVINDYRLAGRYLTRMIIEAVQNPDYKLPDICVYDLASKEWREIFVPDGASRKIRLKKEVVQYNALLMEEGFANVLASFLMTYSDAQINLVELKENLVKANG